MKDELYHHGVDGQKWGVQHGPPYPLDRSAARQEAKKRKARRKNMIKINKKRKKSKQAAEKRDLTYKKSKKPAKQMTNKELNDTIDRLQREETYRQLVSKTKTEKKIAKELKKRNKIAEKQQKNQNEAQQEQRKLQQEQLDLQKKQFKQNKRVNGITRKVVDQILTSAAGVIGTQVTKHLVDNAFAKDNNTQTNTQTNNNQPKSKKSASENLAKNESAITMFKALENMKKDAVPRIEAYKAPENKGLITVENKKKEAYQPMFLDVYSGPRGQYTEDYINKYLLEWGDGL